MTKRTKKEAEKNKVQKMKFVDEKGKDCELQEGYLYFIKAIDHFQREMDIQEWLKEEDPFKPVFWNVFGVYLHEDEDYAFFITNYYEEMTITTEVESHKLTGICKDDIRRVDQLPYKMEHKIDFKFDKYAGFFKEKEKKELGKNKENK